MRAALLGLALAGCSGSMLPDASDDAGTVTVDGGSSDPGFDIPPNEWVDGGQGGSWGCYGKSDQHFIITFQTRDSNQPWCASVLFMRQDGGSASMFPEFDAPDGFALVDARWALTCAELELPNGALNHEGTRPVHALSGSAQLDGFVLGRPQKYSVDAQIRTAYRVSWISQLGSLSATCQGP